MIVTDKTDLIQFWEDNIKDCLSFIWAKGNDDVTKVGFKSGMWYTNDMPVLNYINITEKNKGVISIRDFSKLDELLKDKEIVSLIGDYSTLDISVKGKDE